MHRQIYQAFNFVRSGIYFNPAHIQTEAVEVVSYECPSGTMYYAGAQGDAGPYPFIAVTSGMSGLCTLKHGGRRVADDFVVKELQLNIHELEFSRIVDNMGAIFGFTEAESDYYNSSVGMRTQPVYHGPSVDSAFSLFMCCGWCSNFPS